MRAFINRKSRHSLTLFLSISIILHFFIIPGSLADNRVDWQQPDRVVRDLGLQPGARVADVGSGHGYFTFRLARAVGDDGLVFAVDIDEQALAALKKQATQQRLTNVMTIVSGPTEIRLQPESVDVVFICNVLHEIPEAHRSALIQSAARALRPGGSFYLIDWRKSREVKADPYEKLIPREELIRICTGAGLVLDSEFHYLRYQVFFRFKKNN